MNNVLKTVFLSSILVCCLNVIRAEREVSFADVNEVYHEDACNRPAEQQLELRREITRSREGCAIFHDRGDAEKLKYLLKKKFDSKQFTVKCYISDDETPAWLILYT